MGLGTSALLTGLKHFQAIGDLCQFADTHGGQILFDDLDIPSIIEREKACWVEDFLDSDCSSLQLYKTVYKAKHSI